MTARQHAIHDVLRQARQCVGYALLSVSAVFAQPVLAAEPGPDGNRGHMNRLLHNPTVITHLGLSEAQAKAAQEASNAVVEQHRADFEAASKLGSREEKVAHIARTFVSITGHTFDRLKAVLNPAQHQRLQQIEIQTFALRAFGRPGVVEYLQLSDAQQKALKAIASEAGEQTKANFQSKTLSSEQKSLQGKQIRDNALQKVRQQLSAEQWIKWELLVGARFVS